MMKDTRHINPDKMKALMRSAKRSAQPCQNNSMYAQAIISHNLSIIDLYTKVDRNMEICTCKCDHE